MTFVQLINSITTQLKSAKIETAKEDTLLIIQTIFSLTRSQLLAKLQDHIPKSPSLKQLNSYINRRCTGEPLALILGNTSFLGYPFIIKPGILIPRPETELLVTQVSLFCQSQNLTSPTILELGYGSGCILLSLARQFPNLKGYGWDISKIAYSIAKENQQKLTCPNVTFYHQDFFTDPKVKQLIQYPNTIFISNPPYIPTKTLSKLDQSVTQFEPLTALDGGHDGLIFYKKCFQLFQKSQTPQFYEIGINQKEKLIKIAKKNGCTKYKYYTDYHHIPRILKIN
tara:strand:+ start:347 stop:1198 length:852 start_codon:yes stop_codon:yes gene_type:complete